MKKTALTQLIDRLEDSLIDAKMVTENPKEYDYRDFKKAFNEFAHVQSCINKATELLEVERQDIEDAWIAAEGTFYDAGTEVEYAKKYFNETFKQ
jgi:hypothetical protein